MLPETLDGLLVPAVLAGVVWMFAALVLFKLGTEVTAEQKQRIMAVLTVISGALIALVQVLPAETMARLAEVYQAIRPLLEFVLGTVVAGGVGYTVNQGSYRLYRAIVPTIDEDATARREQAANELREGVDTRLKPVG